MMIIKINGVPIEATGASYEGGAENGSLTITQDQRMANLSKYAGLGTKFLFGLAAATMAADMLLGGGSVAMAATSLSGAFEPVKHILLDLADPLCYVMFIWGCIECMVGRPASGLNRMKYAAMGYIAINWIPVLMEAIRSAGPGGA